MVRRWVLVLVVSFACALVMVPMGSAQESPHANPGWPMFHHDPLHTGLAPGTGTIVPAQGPQVRWAYQLVPEPVDVAAMRWASSFPLGDLDGDGTLEVVVTSPERQPGLSTRVVVLKDDPQADGGVRVLWQMLIDGAEGGVDQYSAALADADGDGLPDVLFSARDGYVRAVKGTDGSLIWQYQTGRIMESGPMVDDLDGDGTLEVVQVTDCPMDNCNGSGSLIVLPLMSPSGRDNTPLWTLDLPWKADSAEPAIADLDPTDGASRKVILAGTWGGRLLAVWQDDRGQIIQSELPLSDLDPSVPADSTTKVIRSSPLVVQEGDHSTVVFAWMPDWNIYSDTRWSAVDVRANMSAGTVEFTPRWTTTDNVWKSSTALVPAAHGGPIVLSGTGIGLANGGGYGCDEVSGGVIARRLDDGELAWSVDAGPGRGDMRSSIALADVDDDGRLEALIGTGCGGDLLAYDAITGAPEWQMPLGPKTFGSPSIGDLNHDGHLEVVIGNYDGRVYALSGGS
ncbi:MAG: PQQ-binding-like beta-propeller repeat protein [Anaerolineae bacterium]